MDRRIIDDHARFLGDCLAKDLETTDNDFRRYRLVHTERGQVVLGGKKTYHIKPFAFGHGHFDRFADGLPGIGNTGIQRKAYFVKIDQLKLAGLVFFLAAQALFLLG